MLMMSTPRKNQCQCGRPGVQRWGDRCACSPQHAQLSFGFSESQTKLCGHPWVWPRSGEKRRVLIHPEDAMSTPPKQHIPIPGAPEVASQRGAVGPSSAWLTRGSSQCVLFEEPHWSGPTSSARPIPAVPIPIPWSYQGASSPHPQGITRWCEAMEEWPWPAQSQDFWEKGDEDPDTHCSVSRELTCPCSASLWTLHGPGIMLGSCRIPACLGGTWALGVPQPLQPPCKVWVTLWPHFTICAGASVDTIRVQVTLKQHEVALHCSAHLGWVAR